MAGLAFGVPSVSSIKMQALKMIVQSGGELGFKKTIRQGRAMRLGNDRNKIKRTFLAVSKETPPDEKCLVQIAFEDDSQNIRTAEKKLQDKIRRINLIAFVEREPGQVHGVTHLGGLGLVFFERNILKRISRGWKLQSNP